MTEENIYTQSDMDAICSEYSDAIKTSNERRASLAVMLTRMQQLNAKNVAKITELEKQIKETKA